MHLLIALILIWMFGETIFVALISVLLVLFRFVCAGLLGVVPAVLLDWIIGGCHKNYVPNGNAILLGFSTGIGILLIKKFISKNKNP